MANPLVVTISPEWAWQKVATNVVTGAIYRLVSTVYYYQTFRLTSEAAPSAPTPPNPVTGIPGVIPDEAIRMFDQSNEELIQSNELIDVYIMCANQDIDSDH